MMQTLPDYPTVEQFFKALENETTALLEHLDLSFLTEYEVFAPTQLGRKRTFEPPQLFRAIIHCFYNDIYGPRPMEREIANDDVYRVCNLKRPPSRKTLDRFITDLASFAEDVFTELVHQVAERLPLGNCFRIDGTHIPVKQQDDDGQWNYDHSTDDYYYGYGCCLVTTDNNIPVAAKFTQAKKVDTETALRVTDDALAVDKPLEIVGDKEFDMLDWHDHVLENNVLPVVPYNPRNTENPLEIDYRVENRIKKHADDVRLSSRKLDETYNQRSSIETTIGVCKDLGLDEPRVRGKTRVKSHVFISLCLRLAVIIANYENDGNISSPFIKL